MRERAHKAAITGAALLAAGCAYLIIILKTGRGIPCVFNMLTGLKCPGCGITHMIVSLARLDFPAAWHSNPVVLILLPLILIVGVLRIIKWVRTGDSKASRPDFVIECAALAALLIFGVVRNIVQI